MSKKARAGCGFLYKASWFLLIILINTIQVTAKSSFFSRRNYIEIVSEVDDDSAANNPIIEMQPFKPFEDIEAVSNDKGNSSSEEDDVLLITINTEVTSEIPEMSSAFPIWTPLRVPQEPIEFIFLTDFYIEYLFFVEVLLLIAYTIVWALAHDYTLAAASYQVHVLSTVYLAYLCMLAFDPASY